MFQFDPVFPSIPFFLFPILFYSAHETPFPNSLSSNLFFDYIVTRYDHIVRKLQNSIYSKGYFLQFPILVLHQMFVIGQHLRNKNSVNFFSLFFFFYELKKKQDKIQEDLLRCNSKDVSKCTCVLYKFLAQNPNKCISLSKILSPPKKYSRPQRKAVIKPLVTC